MEDQIHFPWVTQRLWVMAYLLFNLQGRHFELGKKDFSFYTFSSSLFSSHWQLFIHFRPSLHRPHKRPFIANLMLRSLVGINQFDGHLLWPSMLMGNNEETAVFGSAAPDSKWHTALLWAFKVGLFTRFEEGICVGQLSSCIIYFSQSARSTNEGWGNLRGHISDLSRVYHRIW